MTLLHELNRWAGTLVDEAVAHLWQSTLFGLLILGLGLALRRAPARLRHDLHLLACARFLLPPALLAGLAGFLSLEPSGWLPASLLSFLDGRPLAGAMAGLLANGAGRGTAPAPAGGTLWLAGLGVWAAVAAVLAGSWAWRLLEVRRSLRRGRRVARGPLRDRLDAQARRLGVRRPVALVLSQEVAEPGVWGVLAPQVVLPRQAPDQLCPEELDAVLLHELVHVKRHDNLIGVLLMVLRCLLWFHPLVWWLERRLLAERERACDERVVEVVGGSRDYLRGLAKVLGSGLGWRLQGVSSVSGSDLRRRIEHLRRGGGPAPTLAHRGVLTAAIGLLALSAAVALPAAKGSAKTYLLARDGRNLERHPPCPQTLELPSRPPRPPALEGACDKKAPRVAEEGARHPEARVL